MTTDQKRTTKKFPKALLKQLSGNVGDKTVEWPGSVYDDVEDPSVAETGTYTRVSVEQVDKRRWVFSFWLVFRAPGDAEGEAWGVSYDEGSGDEGQAPFEYEDAMVDCEPLVAKQVITTSWVADK